MARQSGPRRTKPRTDEGLKSSEDIRKAGNQLTWLINWDFPSRGLFLEDEVKAQIEQNREAVIHHVSRWLPKDLEDDPERLQLIPDLIEQATLYEANRRGSARLETWLKKDREISEEIVQWLVATFAPQQLAKVPNYLSNTSRVQNWVALYCISP